MNKITSIEDYPSQEELDAGGYLLVVEESTDDTYTGWDVVDPALLTDVTEVDVEEVISTLNFTRKNEGFAERVYLIREPRLVLEAGMNGLHVFISTNSLGERVNFMIVGGQRSRKTQSAVVRMLEDGIIPDNKFATPE